ncbi:MAG: FtsQ-type POTRA domain-containing protein [Gemmatimonadota bacterium]|nr:FtsQ-type POTRA domain-containing protein [Gemmatimonadota bacterium]
MRRDVRILLGTLVLGGGFLAWEHGTDFVTEMDTFRVEQVEVRGVRLVDDDELVGLLALEPTSSIWSDATVWEQRVEEHPMIEEATVSRRFPDGLTVEVSERRPVALAPTPTLEPIDVEGHRLPVDPSSHRLDLPVLTTDRTPASGSPVVPDEVRALAREIGRIMAADTAFLQRVSELGWRDDGSLRLRWTEPPVDFLLPAGTPPARLREGLSALADAMGRRPTDPPEEIDLRFADQVVVRRTRGQ